MFNLFPNQFNFFVHPNTKVSISSCVGGYQYRIVIIQMKHWGDSSVYYISLCHARWLDCYYYLIPSVLLYPHCYCILWYDFPSLVQVVLLNFIWKTLVLVVGWWRVFHSIRSSISNQNSRLSARLPSSFHKRGSATLVHWIHLALPIRCLLQVQSFTESMQVRDK